MNKVDGTIKKVKINKDSILEQDLSYTEIDNTGWNTLTPEAILEDFKTEIKSTSR